MTLRKSLLTFFISGTLTLSMNAQTTTKDAKASTVKAPPAGAPTVAEATKFIDDAEQRLNDVVIALTTQLAEASRRYDELKLPPDVARKFKLLRLSLTLPAPDDAAERAELTKIAASMEGEYGKGKYCPQGPN